LRHNFLPSSFFLDRRGGYMLFAPSFSVQLHRSIPAGVAFSPCLAYVFSSGLRSFLETTLHNGCSMIGLAVSDQLNS
jgi:hypothetical protein